MMHPAQAKVAEHYLLPVMRISQEEMLILHSCVCMYECVYVLRQMMSLFQFAVLVHFLLQGMRAGVSFFSVYRSGASVPLDSRYCNHSAVEFP